MKIIKLILLILSYSSLSMCDTAPELAKKQKIYEEFLQKTGNNILVCLELHKFDDSFFTKRVQQAMDKAIYNYLAAFVEYTELLEQVATGSK